MRKLVTLRLKKLKSPGALRLAFEHNTRDRPPPYAYPERSHLNQVDNTTQESMEAYRALLPGKVRKNAVHAVEFVVQASPGTPEPILVSYFNASIPWLAAKLGGHGNRLGSAIHYDEETPHLHLVMMPLRDGRLNYNSYLGGNKFQLRKLQTDFAREVGSQFGLERGVERSGIENRNHNDYRQQMTQPLKDLPVVSLPDPRPWLLNLRAYGEEIARLFRAAYEPLIDRLTAMTNRVRVLEEDKLQVMVVSSARAKENDELRAEVGRLKGMIRDGGGDFEQLRSELQLEEERKSQAEEELRQRREEHERKAADAESLRLQKEAERDASAPKAPEPPRKRGRKRDNGYER